MKHLLILGAGGFGQMAKETALELGYEQVVFLDDAAAVSYTHLFDCLFLKLQERFHF